MKVFARFILFIRNFRLYFNRSLQLNPQLPNLYRACALAYKIKGNATLAQADELRAAQLESGR